MREQYVRGTAMIVFGILMGALAFFTCDTIPAQIIGILPGAICAALGTLLLWYASMY